MEKLNELYSGKDYKSKGGRNAKEVISATKKIKDTGTRDKTIDAIVRGGEETIRDLDKVWDSASYDDRLAIAEAFIWANDASDKLVPGLDTWSKIFESLGFDRRENPFTTWIENYFSRPDAEALDNSKVRNLNNLYATNKFTYDDLITGEDITERRPNLAYNIDLLSKYDENTIEKYIKIKKGLQNKGLSQEDVNEILFGDKNGNDFSIFPLKTIEGELEKRNIKDLSSKRDADKVDPEDDGDAEKDDSTNSVIKSIKGLDDFNQRKLLKAILDNFKEVIDSL